MVWTEERREKWRQQDNLENQLKWQRDMQQIEADFKGLPKLFGEIKALEFVLSLPPMTKQQYLSRSSGESYHFARYLREQLASKLEGRTP